MSHKENCGVWCLQTERLFILTRKCKINHSSACLVLLEVIINGVLQLPELFFLLHFLLFLVSSQSRFDIILFIIIILLFLQRQRGGRAAEERVRGRFWGGGCAEHKTPGISNRVSYSTYLPLTPAHPDVTSAICSSMTTVATWLDFTISWVTPFAVSFSWALQVCRNLLKSDVGNFSLTTKCCHFNRTICYCAKSGERQTEKDWEKERNSRIKTVNIQVVDRKTGTPYNILQSNTTAMQRPLEVLLFHL